MSNRQQAKIVSLPLFPTTARPGGVGALDGALNAAATGALVAAAESAASGFEALRRRAAGEHGKRYWRSIQELADTPELAEYVHREFPEQAGEWHDPVSRRNFMRLMGASLALAGVGFTGGCEQNEEKIVPYVNPPENMIPGKPMFYATALPFRAGQGIGVLVEQNMGRPTKIEGNPEHPASLGATDALTQASILSLYDPDRAGPDRSGAVQELGHITTWSLFFRRMEGALYENGQPKQDVRVRVLTETVCSPTLGAQIKALLERFPQGRWHQYEPVNRDNVNVGARAIGNLNTYYDFSKAERVLSLDCNFLHDEPGSLRYARQFIDGRRVRVSKDEAGHKHIHRETAKKARSEMTPVKEGFEINRLYVAESTPTITGAMADHRLALRPSQVYDLAIAIARAVGVAGAGEGRPLSAEATQWADAVAEDLRNHAGRCVVIAGDHQPPEVHVLAHAINAGLNNVGQTVLYTDPVEAEPQPDFGAGAKASNTQVQSLAALVGDMDAGNVDVLLILGGNPVYTAPADIDFGAALDKFGSAKSGDGKQQSSNVAVHLSPSYDETSIRCRWHLPESHPLEAWGDLRAFDGTVTFQQPLISPLYGTRPAIEIVAGLLLNPDPSGYDVVRAHWQSQEGVGGPDFEKTWSRSLHDGILAGSAFRVRPANLRPDLASVTARPAIPAKEGAYEVCFRPDPYVWDGRWANNGWLMELPKPLTKITWDNVIHMSPRTAEKLGVEHRKSDSRHLPMYTLRRGGREITGPVWISFGHPDDSVTVHFGFGRTRAGRIGGTDAATSHGFNVYALRTSDTPGYAADVEIGKDPRGKTWEIACTQHHQLIDFTHVNAPSVDTSGPYKGENLNEQRELVKMYDYETYKSDTHAAHHAEHISIYPPYSYDTNGLHKWGMVIDQNACIGCNACVTACQSENNIAVVGKEQVIFQREMHWLRIDTYYTGDPVSPDMLFQPMLCQHCENAPCETVCPVAATSHSDEGLNEMTYNRCVGTRYCSNNCPYKVRRFNYLQYNDNRIASLKLMRNPNVTVRNRGVMEKCSYCVQRVNHTRIEVKKRDADAVAAEDPALRDRLHNEAADILADLQTACQQACPTEAIVFGDLNYAKKIQVADKPRLSVERLKEQPGDVHYGLLTELNTRPRTTYLARFRNLNPALAPAGGGEATPSEPKAHG